MAIAQEPTFWITRSGTKPLVGEVIGLRESRVELWIENASLVTARNVTVRLEPVAVEAPNVIDGLWAVADRDMVGIHAIQWEGGSEYAIHGKYKRRIGFFSFEHARLFAGAEERCGLRITIAADGFVKTTFLPISLSESPNR